MNFPRTRFKSNLRKFNFGLAFMVRQMCVRVPCGIPHTPYTHTPPTHTQIRTHHCVWVYLYLVCLCPAVRAVTIMWPGHGHVSRFVCFVARWRVRERERQQAGQGQSNVQINFYKFLRGISFAIHSHSCRCPKMPAQSVTVTEWVCFEYFGVHPPHSSGTPARAYLFIHSLRSHSCVSVSVYVCLQFSVWKATVETQKQPQQQQQLLKEQLKLKLKLCCP